MRISLMFASLIRWVNAELSASQISLAGAAMDQSNGLTGPALEDGSIVMMVPVDEVGVRVGMGVEDDVTGGIAVGDAARVGIGVEDDVTGGIAVGDAARVGIGVEEDVTGGIAVGDAARAGIGVEDDVTGGIAVGDAARAGTAVGDAAKAGMAVGVGEETNPIKPIESIYNVTWL